MAEDTLSTFLAAPTEERFRMALDPQHAPELEAYFGAPAFAEYVALAEQAISKLDEGHLGINSPINLIFIPGIMGSMLRSETLGGVWWIDVLRGRDKLNKLGLTPDGTTDSDPTYKIVPFEIDVVYAPFLKAVLDRDDFGHAVFPYDWRKSLTLSTARLRDKINDTYDRNGNQPVHLVGHSMGGLMIRATLREYGDLLWPKIGKIVFIGTPHYGSPVAVRNVKFHLWGPDMTDMFLALMIKPETLRSLWGAVGLMPAPRGTYPGTRPNVRRPWSSGDPQDPYIHPCVNFDLYDAAAWQLDLPPEQTARIQRIFDHAGQFYRDMYDYHLSLDQGLRDRMAVIAGVGQKTLFRLAYKSGIFGQKMSLTNDRVPGDPQREGDGTVPLASVTLEYVGATRYIRGEHANLPMQAAVYGDVFRWLKGEQMQLPDTPEQALSQHLGAEAALNEYPALTGPAQAHTRANELDEPDYSPPDPATQAAIEARIQAGDIPPELNLVRPF